MRVFLLASFPSLQFQEPAPLKLEQMLARCADHLSPDEMDELDSICSDPPSGPSPFARDWAAAWRQIRFVNQRERLRRLPADAAQDLEPAAAPEHDDNLRAALRRAWEAETPLQRELALLAAQWDWLETRRRAAPYSRDDLLAYALQLRLLEQRDAWKEETGAEQFAEQTETFMSPLLETLREKEMSA